MKSTDPRNDHHRGNEVTMESDVLEWFNINLQLMHPKSWFSSTPPTVKRHLLRNISGTVSSGQLLAIMGPTGCGKTSLMNVLAGKITYSRNIRLTGEIYYNGEFMDHGILSSSGNKQPHHAHQTHHINTDQHQNRKTSHHQHQSVGYVAQDEKLFAFLTVRETLLLASYFHIPSHGMISQSTLLSPSSSSISNSNDFNNDHPSTLHQITLEERNAMVEHILRELSLLEAADTIIGNEMRRGVSGGEYRRVLIGKEMMKNPHLFFLDEPTSGLDSYQALSVMETMKTLTLYHGRIVVTVIHQPRSSIFNLFDRLLLLSEGQVIFFGPMTAALDYFKVLGFECPSLYNPADYYLDILSIDMKSVEGETTSKTRLAMFAKYWQAYHRSSNDEIDGIDRLVFESQTKSSLRSERRKHDHNETHDDLTYATKKPCSSWCSDFRILLWRSFANVYRNYGALLIRGVTSIFFAILVALIYRNLGYQQQDIQNRSGLLYFVIINQGFSPLIVTLTVFSSEKLIVNREVMSGSYQFSSYYFGRILADIPFQLFIAFIYCAIVYWTTGLYPAVDRFFIFVVVIMLATLNAAALGYLVSSFSPNEQVANAIGPPVFIILLLYGGFYINASSLPIGSVWVRNLSLVYWGFQAIVVNEFKGSTFKCQPNTSGNRCVTNGSTNTNILDCILILIALTIGFVILGYFCLVLSKQRYCKIVPNSDLPPLQANIPFSHHIDFEQKEQRESEKVDHV